MIRLLNAQTEPQITLLLRLYLFGTRIGYPLANWYIRHRPKREIESETRTDERLGHPSLPRPSGCQLVWIHATGVGELLASSGLIKCMLRIDPEIQFLLTSFSRSTAEAIQFNLPAQSRHQFAPIDCPQCVTTFLDHWQPDLAIVTESEIWPRLTIDSFRRRIPLAIVNGRLPPSSFRKRNRARRSYGSLLQLFDHIEAKDDESRRNFRLLGAITDRVHMSGSIKAGAEPLSDFPDHRRGWSNCLSGRRLWLASSTHTGEEEVVVEAHFRALERDPNLVLAIAPRDPSRAGAIGQTLSDRGVTFSLQSSTDPPESFHAQVVIVSSFGQLGLWYRLAFCALVGGSLTDIGGHNPYEPALLNCSILTGPFVSNFRDDYQILQRANACRVVRTSEEIAEAVLELDHQHQSLNALGVVAQGRKSLMGSAEALVGLMRGRLLESQSVSPT